MLMVIVLDNILRAPSFFLSVYIFSVTLNKHAWNGDFALQWYDPEIKDKEM